MKRQIALFAQTLPLAFIDQGEGQAYLLLHGGAGPGSMAGLAGALGKTGRAVMPTHPGFDGEARPDGFVRIADLVLAYLALIEALDLARVIVIGNSVGGWIAAEMALRHSPRVAGIVILNGVGIDTGAPDKAIVNPMAVDPVKRAALAFHDPARFAIAPADANAAAMMAANQQTLRVYAGQPFMHDPGLRARLAGMTIPALVAWGVSDGIVDLDYGRSFAASMPTARFAPIAGAAHFPQIERLDETLHLIDDFVKQLASADI